MNNKIVFSLGALSLGLGACSTIPVTLNEKPAYLGAVQVKAFDGATDDLLTAGLGRTGLAGAAPAAADPLNPTAAELRRLAIHTNYRAIVDVSANGGYGRLYGPNLDAAGNDTLGDGKVAGKEYLAYSDDGSGKVNVTLLVQIPARFDAASPCIVTATSSGSRGVYGAIGSAGEWGLKRGCAVAYTDKGTGSGAHDLARDTVNRIDGVRVAASAAAGGASFDAGLSTTERSAFEARTPGRFAFKHAHSRQNPEKDWGRYTLQAVEFALYALNQEYGQVFADGSRARRYRGDNTLVIASSVSNGGGAAIAAAEQDSSGLIDGVAVTEPNLVLPASAAVTVMRGANVVGTTGKALYDYFTIAHLYQPCAALAAGLEGAPLRSAILAPQAGARCASLRDAGLVSGVSTAEQSVDALRRLRAFGWEAESDVLHASHYAFATPAISVTYANAFGRFSVTDNLCGIGFAATVAGTGVPTSAAPAAVANLFATGNGVPPTAGINLVSTAVSNGPIVEALGVSPGTGRADYNFDAAQCFRQLAVGNTPEAGRVRSGIDEVRRTGDLRGKPAIIVHGRADALVPVNHTSRPYLGLNRMREGNASRLSYIEVTHGQHFDAFLGIPGFDTRFVPLHVYFNRAMDAMYAHLKHGAPLPASQVVRTTPRGGAPGAAPALQSANLPAIVQAPAAGDRITVTTSGSGAVVNVPD
jgi:hydroxybutyrate-dimer hydrolase